MLITVEDNPNCGGDERMLRDNGKKRQVARMNVETPAGGSTWCDVTGIDQGGSFVPAYATQVEDSSAGSAWLIFGGSWGLRFRPAGQKVPWSLEDKNQWGEPFKVFDLSGGDIQFKEGPDE